MFVPRGDIILECTCYPARRSPAGRGRARPTRVLLAGSRTERYSDDASRDSNLVRRQQGQCFYKGAFAVRHQDSDKILGGIKRSQLLIDRWLVSVADLY